MAIRSVEYLQSLVRELAKLPDETDWVEFKCNNKQPQMIVYDTLELPKKSVRIP